MPERTTNDALRFQPAARKLLTEIWRLRLIEIQTEHFLRYLVHEKRRFGGLEDALMRGLRETMGLPMDDSVLDETPKPPHLGVWQSERRETPEHRARSNELGHALTTIEWGDRTRGGK